jgi:L-alanine-DL-glutamate epimerase-like enolase superfamily enzyme
VSAYASGIHVDAASAEIDRARAAGFRVFKVKVGFDAAREPDRLRALAAGLAEGEHLLADANQAWDRASAREFLDAVSDVGLGWMEEPIPADAPDEDWQALADGPVRLAGGENLAGTAAYDAALRLGALGFLQPDVAKWGGVTGCLDVARKALAAGRTYCPHFLGGGIGLAASAHVLAAAGGPGLLEVDVNPNPLRDAFASGGGLVDGRWRLGAGAGLGIVQLPDEVCAAVTHTRTAQAGRG